MLWIVLLERSRGVNVGDEGVLNWTLELLVLLCFYFIVDELFFRLWWGLGFEFDSDVLLGLDLIFMKDNNYMLVRLEMRLMGCYQWFWYCCMSFFKILCVFCIRYANWWVGLVWLTCYRCWQETLSALVGKWNIFSVFGQQLWFFQFLFFLMV